MKEGLPTSCRGLGYIAAALAMCLLPSTVGLAAVTAIRDVTVIDTIGASDLPDATILIRDGVIEAVSKEPVQIPAGATIIDGRGKFLIPGIVDGHVHFFQSGGLYARPDILNLTSVVPYAREVGAVRSGVDDQLQRYVAAGVTGAIDMGGPAWNFELRDAAAALPIAPRLFVAGPLLSPYQPAELVTVDPPILLTRSPAEALQQVEAQIERKPDFLKFWYVLEEGQNPRAHLPILEAIVAVGRAANIPVAVHATQLETARLAVAAGANVLVHSVDDREVDDAFVAAIRKAGTFYIPTMLVNERYSAILSGENPLPASEQLSGKPDVVATLAGVEAPDFERVPGVVGPTAFQLSVMHKNLKKLSDAGVPIVMGTDAGNIGTLHAVSIANEMRRMVQAGMSARAVLASATSVPARLLGRSDLQGSVTAGKAADLVLLGSNPLLDIGAVANVEMVMLNGRRVPQSLDPAAAVQRQVDAFNRHDVAAFAATYAKDVEIFRLGATTTRLLRGREKLEELYAGEFASYRPHAMVSSRRVLGSFVVDQETVRSADGKVVQATAIYEVRDGLIQRVWFVQPPD